MTHEQLEAQKMLILEATRRQADIDPTRDPGVECVLGQIPGYGYATALRDHRWLLQLMQDERLLDLVHENSSGSFALRLTPRGHRLLALSNN
jgi:hypothetical protein